MSTASFISALFSSFLQDGLFPSQVADQAGHAALIAYFHSLGFVDGLDLSTGISIQGGLLFWDALSHDGWQPRYGVISRIYNKFLFWRGSFGQLKSAVTGVSVATVSFPMPHHHANDSTRGFFQTVDCLVLGSKDTATPQRPTVFDPEGNPSMEEHTVALPKLTLFMCPRPTGCYRAPATPCCKHGSRGKGLGKLKCAAALIINCSILTHCCSSMLSSTTAAPTWRRIAWCPYCAALRYSR